jgi:hypothetical protein
MNTILKQSKYLLLILLFLLFSGYTDKEKNNPLIGKWQYHDCTIKNTSVSGTIVFFEDSTFFFNGLVSEDFPTEPFECKYKYVVSGNKLSCLTTEFPAFERPPIAEYFFIKGDDLYLSGQPMKKVIDDWSGSYRETNWTYHLKRAN